MKKFGFMVLLIIICLYACALPAEKVNAYYKIAESENLFKIYRSYELTTEILTNRNGTIIIEEVIGRCIDEQTGAGVMLGKEDEYYNYISYKDVKNVGKNDIVCSYLIYNPDNNYEDDIIERYDFIIDKAIQNPLAAIDGEFYGESFKVMRSDGNFETLYKFKSYDNSVWWALTEQEIGHMPAENTTYTLIYYDNGTNRENHTCPEEYECDCYCYDDILVAVIKR